VYTAIHTGYANCLPAQRHFAFMNAILLHGGHRHVSSTHLTVFRVLSARIRGLLEKYPTFGREKETGLLGALDT